jgi:transposase
VIRPLLERRTCWKVEAIANQYVSAAETERMMKVQEGVLKAMAGRLKWSDAIEIIGISDRSLRRWRERYQEHGCDGLYDRRERRPSPKKVPVKDVERVLQLCREKYFDFNVRHSHEKLAEGHGIQLSYTWVKLALQTVGLLKKQKHAGRIDGAGHDDRYRGCCCILMPASTPGFRMTDITI